MNQRPIHTHCRKRVRREYLRSYPRHLSAKSQASSSQGRTKGSQATHKLFVSLQPTSLTVANFTMTLLTKMIEYQPQSVVTTLWALLAAYLLGVFVYRVWFHPLAKYPGPFFARFTDIYPMIAMFKMTRCYWQNDMIQKYGSPVRVSTNQLFFADMRSWVDIYGQSSSPCLKEPGFYDQMTATGATSVFNATSKVEHARVRRLLSHAFSLSALLKDEALVRRKVDELDRLVFEPAARLGQSVDIFGKMMCNFLDISSHFSYGESFNSLSGRGDISHADMDCL